MGDVTEPLWDLHKGKGDCTHFCYNPSLVEAWAYLVARIIARSDAGKTVDDWSEAHAGHV